MRHELKNHERRYLDSLLDESYVEDRLRQSFDRLDAPAFSVYAKVGEIGVGSIWVESDGSFVDYYVQS